MIIILFTIVVLVLLIIQLIIAKNKIQSQENDKFIAESKLGGALFRIEQLDKKMKVLNFINHNDIYLTKGKGNYLLTVNELDVALLTLSVKGECYDDWNHIEDWYGYDFNYLPSATKTMINHSKVLSDCSMGFASLVASGDIEVKMGE